MVQIELYLRELTRFLQTVTLKNNYFVDHMTKIWVKQKFQPLLEMEPQKLPYYRHLMGDYILRKSDIEKFRETYINEQDSYLTLDAYCLKYGLSYKIQVGDIEYSNEMVYSKFDTLIKINSIDSQQAVPFTRNMLELNPKTKSVYKIPIDYYTNVCKNYPLYVDMIKAIVYPITSVQEAINAKNYTILNCDLQQLQQNERQSMFVAMEQTLNWIRYRWDVAQFTYEDMYAVSIQGKIWNILLLTLLNQRIQNIRTSAVHNYHLWRYLESYGIEDGQYILTSNQANFLYKNFPYIIHNRGSYSNLILLTHKLLNSSGITIKAKTLLQNKSYTNNGLTHDMRGYVLDSQGVVGKTTDIQAYPKIKSTYLCKNIINKLEQIQGNSSLYLNKILKVEDELKALNNSENDYQDLQSGQNQLLDDIFQKQQDSGLQYTDELLFEESTSTQRNLFSHTPHTKLTTKLLEFAHSSTSTLFDQIYAKFMTQSLLYRAAIGDADYIITFTIQQTGQIIKLSIKQAIAMVQYCYLKLNGMYDDNMHAPKYAILTIPWKKKFNKIPQKFTWQNFVRNTNEKLNIIPNKISLRNNPIDEVFDGIYNLINPQVERTKWIWENGNKCRLKFNAESTSSRYWSLSSGDFIYKCDNIQPYSNWKKWDSIWHDDVYEYDLTFIVDSYSYVLDTLMHDDSSVVIKSYNDLITFLNTQAYEYLQLYWEMNSSTWARQLQCAYNILQDRTIKGTFQLDLLNGKTYQEFIKSDSDLQKFFKHLEYKNQQDKQIVYAKFSNSILQKLFPITNAQSILNKALSSSIFEKIKKLFISLCSYNIAFISNSSISNYTTYTLADHIVYDLINTDYSFTISTPMSNITVSNIVKLFLDDYIDHFAINCSVGEYHPCATIEAFDIVMTSKPGHHFPTYWYYPDDLIQVKNTDVIYYNN